MKKYMTKFLNDTSGAVTVDWVVLTAAVVFLGITVMTTIGGGVDGGVNNIEIGLAAN